MEAEKFKPIVLPLPKLEIDKKTMSDNKTVLAQLRATMTGSTTELTAALQENVDGMKKAFTKMAARVASFSPPSLVESNYADKFRAWLAQQKKNILLLTQMAKDLNAAIAELNSIVITAIRTPSHDVNMATLVAAGTTGSADDVASAQKAVAEAQKNRDAVKDGTQVQKDAADEELQTRKNTLADKQRQLGAEQDQAKAEHDQNKKNADQVRADAIALVVATAKAGIDLENARLANQLARAQQTPGIKDDKKAFQAQINFNRNVVIAGLVKERSELKKNSKDYKLHYREISTEIQNVIGLNIGLRASMKGLAGQASGGFSIADLFKEALTQFNEFGSNVSSSPMTPGGVRGQLGGDIVRNIITNPKVQKDLKVVGIEGIDKNTADAAKYMKFLYEYFTGNKAPSGTVPDDVVTPRGAGVGHWTAAQAKAFAKVRGN
jgi:hypothetical protein